jgi:large subunit ribosomal protein L35
LIFNTAQPKTIVSLWLVKAMDKCPGKLSERLIGGRYIMKMRTHAGAKKRLKLLSSGKIKKKSTRLRHLNSHMSSKTKRQLGKTSYVDDANLLQARRLLVF